MNESVVGMIRRLVSDFGMAPLAVAAYLDKTQFYVVDVEKSLKLVLKYLDLKELPPLKGNL